MQTSVQRQFNDFDLRLNDVLARTRYFRVETDAERDRIYRLRYRAYRQEGAIEVSRNLKFHDRYDADRNALVIGVAVDGELAGSIRLHITSPDEPRGPALDTYPEVLAPMLGAGESFIDPGRFVTDPGLRSRVQMLPFVVTRLACMAAEHYEADWMLATVRLEHAAFYKRFCRLQPLAALRPYPGLLKPLMLMGERNEDIRASVFARYPVFSSTMSERFALFGPQRDFAHRSDQAATPNDNSAAAPAFRPRIA